MKFTLIKQLLSLLPKYFTRHKNQSINQLSGSVNSDRRITSTQQKIPKKNPKITIAFTSRFSFDYGADDVESVIRQSRCTGATSDKQF